jgi:L-malate glycosyltransferase
MKLFVISHIQTVDWNFEKYRAMASIAPDLEVMLVVPRWQADGSHYQIDPADWQHGSFRVAPISDFTQNNSALFSFGVDVLTLLHQFRPNIIQIEQGSDSLGYAELIAFNQLLELNAKNIIFVWENGVSENGVSVPQFSTSLLEIYNLHHTHGAIAGGQTAANTLRQRGYRGPIQVASQLPLNDDRSRPRHPLPLAAQLRIRTDDFIIGCVGASLEEQGLLTLCHALAELLNHTDRPWKCVLLGPTPFQDTLFSKAMSLGIDDRLICLEQVTPDMLPNYINLMHALVLPTQTAYAGRSSLPLWEVAFEQTLVQAMACQVPIISGKSGDISFTLDHAKLVFPDGDATALREHICALMHAPKAAIGQAKQGYQSAPDHMNQSVAQQQLTFYRQLFKDERAWLN